MATIEAVSPAGSASRSLRRALPVHHRRTAVAVGFRRGSGSMGADTGEVFDDVASYSVSTNSWSVRSPMRAKRSFFAAGAVGGRIVAAGGGEAAESTAVELYEPETGR